MTRLTMMYAIFSLFILYPFIGVGFSSSCRNVIIKTCGESDCSLYPKNCSAKQDCPKYINASSLNYEVNQDRGIMNVYFELLPPDCCYICYEATLFVEEQSEICTTNATYKDILSLKTFLPRICANGICLGNNSSVGKVVFKHVFSGCYQLAISSHRISGGQRMVRDRTFYVKTNATKGNFSSQPLQFTHRHNLEENELMLTIAYPLLISKTVIELKFCGNQSSVTHAKINLKDEDFCNRTEQLRNDHKGYVCFLTTDSSNSCTFKTIECNFQNIHPGNYCIEVSVNDDRCEKGTIWTTKSCLWKHNLVLGSRPSDKPYVNTFSFLGIAVGFVAVVGVLLLFGLFGFWIIKRNRSLQDSHIELPRDEVIRPMMLKKKVLLLYPRDCKEFMDVMESFRKVLIHCCNVEMFDCYKNDEVLNGPMEWIQNLMDKPKLHTIIVTSNCGCLLQKALRSGHPTTNYSFYKEPTFLDGVFMYGLKLIMEDISPGLYKKNFVIGFDGFSENMNALNLPTSFRRYIIADHFTKLLADIDVEIREEYSHLENVPEYISLKENIKTLAEYKLNNPHYLCDVLNIN